jgi:hypothetical protein
MVPSASVECFGEENSLLQESVSDLLVNHCGASGCLKSNTELGVAVSVSALDHFLILTNLS